MINTYAMQTIFAEKKHWYGFSMNSSGGLVRQLVYGLRKQHIDITPNDVVRTLQYMLTRGWVTHTGYYLSEKLYKVIG